MNRCSLTRDTGEWKHKATWSFPNRRIGVPGRYSMITTMIRERPAITGHMLQLGSAS
jgi:hypothetical protein